MWMYQWRGNRACGQGRRRVRSVSRSGSLARRGCRFRGGHGGLIAWPWPFGNAHGFYREEPKLDFARLEAINRLVDVPLVLHGSSGIPEADLRRAIELGIRKVNVGTETLTAF